MAIEIVEKHGFLNHWQGFSIFFSSLTDFVVSFSATQVPSYHPTAHPKWLPTHCWDHSSRLTISKILKRVIGNRKRRNNTVFQIILPLTDFCRQFFYNETGVVQPPTHPKRSPTHCRARPWGLTISRIRNSSMAIEYVVERTQFFEPLTGFVGIFFTTHGFSPSVSP